MKPLPFLCAIIELNILWLPGLRELSLERGNLGLCPPSAPATWHQPGSFSLGTSQKSPSTATGLLLLG